MEPPRTRPAAIPGLSSAALRPKGKNRADYHRAGGDTRGVPVTHPIWERPFEGNAAVLDMEGGTEPRTIFPDLESAMNYINDNAALAQSEAWIAEITEEGDVILYIADDTQQRGRAA